MEEVETSRKNTILRVFTGIALVLVFISAYKIVRLYPIAQRLQKHGQNLLALRDLSPNLILNEPALAGITADMLGMNVALSDLKKTTSLELKLLSQLDWLPSFGGDLVALPVLLDLGVESTGTAYEAINGILPLITLHEEQPLADRARNSDPAVAAALERSQPYFDQALSHYDKVLDALDQLSKLPPAAHIDPLLKPYLDKAEPILPLARLGLETAATNSAVIDAALGLSRPHHYLVLLQNTWEMRATGGFITAAVKVTVAGGEIEVAPFIDSYDVDLQMDSLPLPPDSLQKAMWAGVWVFRDTNWSPDFPTSAKWAQSLYQIGREDTIDGTIALNPVVIQYLLEAVGPVSVPDFQTTVTAENMWEQLATFHDVPPGMEQDDSLYDRGQNRKAFLALVAEPLLSELRASATDIQALIGLAQKLIASLDERHLLVSIPNEPVGTWFEEHQWDGSLWQGPGDYLQVVDSNVGYNKADARVSRDIEYQVDLEPSGDAIAQVTISYQNDSLVENSETCVQKLVYGGYDEGWVDACYWNFVRIFVPAGSQLITSAPKEWPNNSLWRRENPAAGDPGTLVSHQVNGKQSYGMMLVVPPGQERSVSFHYKLPLGIWNADEGYRLYFQKQSGTINTPVRVDINLLPGIMAESKNNEQTGGQLASTFSLRKDETIQVQLSGQVVEALSVRPAVTPSPSSTPTRVITTSPARTTTLTTEPTPTPVQLLVTATPTDEVPTIEETPIAEKATWSRVEIPKANIDGSIVEVGWKLVGPSEARRAEWEVAAFAAGHHKDSAYPGENGNIVLSGHHNILGEIFRDLWVLEPGDMIYLTDSRGQRLQYSVREVNILPVDSASNEVRMSYLSYIQQKPEPILTLVTCWPYETNTHRTIVVANLVP